MCSWLRIARDLTEGQFYYTTPAHVRWSSSSLLTRSSHQYIYIVLYSLTPNNQSAATNLIKASIVIHRSCANSTTDTNSSIYILINALEWVWIEPRSEYQITYVFVCYVVVVVRIWIGTDEQNMCFGHIYEIVREETPSRFTPWTIHLVNRQGQTIGRKSRDLFRLKYHVILFLLAP